MSKTLVDLQVEKVTKNVVLFLYRCFCTMEERYDKKKLAEEIKKGLLEADQEFQMRLEAEAGV